MDLGVDISRGIPPGLVKANWDYAVARDKKNKGLEKKKLLEELILLSLSKAVNW